MFKKLFHNFGFFYYSQGMEDLKRSDYEGNHYANYFKTMLGKIKRYNEWRSSFPFFPLAWRWKDLKFMGIGFYHHTENR